MINKEFDSDPVFGDSDKYIKTKKKVYGDKVNTNFQGKKIPKENMPCKCLSLIMPDSVVEVNHPQTFLEKSKYKITEEKKKNPINDFNSSSCDNESGNESDNDESNN